MDLSPRGSALFWTSKIAEHNDLLHLGYAAMPAVAQHALSLKQRWLRLLGEAVRGERNVPNLLTEIRPLLQEQSSFQNQLLAPESQGTFLGWLSPSTLQHMQSEMDYAAASMAGSLTPAQEAAWWVGHFADEASTVQHLLDPAQVAKTDAAGATAASLHRLYASRPAPYTALQAGQELSTFLKGLGLGTPAAPVLMPLSWIAHEQSEHDRGLAILATLR